MPAAGPDKKLCGAQRLGQPKGVRCRQRAGWGTEHPGEGYCKRHGGATRSHKTAAQKEMARQACAILGIGRSDTVDPAEALMGEVARTQYAIEWYETQIAALSLDVAEEGKDGRAARIEAHRDLWMAERKHLGDVTARALHAGVARRQIEMMEGVARQVVGVLAEFARLMGHDPASPQVREAGREALQLVAGGGG